MEHYYISSTKYTLLERQTKRYGKVYDVAFRVLSLDGKEIQKRLCGYETKTAAKEAYTKFVTEYCTLSKRNPLKKKQPEKQCLVFGELYSEYLLSLRNQVKDSTIYSKQKAYKNFFQNTLGNEEMDALTKAHLMSWQEDIWSMKNPKTGEYYSHKYLGLIRTHLGSFLEWAQDKYNCPNNLTSVKKPRRRVSATQIEIWTREEFEQFIAVVDNPTLHAIFTMLFFTGRRKGEVLALNYSDVKQDKILFNKTYNRKTIDGSPYNITSTKNEKRDWTIICAPLAKELETYQGQKPFFFGGEHPIHENTLSHAFDRYIQKAGVKRIRIHDLRHSFVSNCIHLGANVYVVASLIGDTPEQVLKTYGHMYDSDKKEIISKIK